MAILELFNTLSGKIEPLAPVGAPALRMYCCGPTVYDYGHIGNFRTFLHVDVLRRFIRQQGIETQHVMNVTDVDDKIIRNAANAGLPIAEYTAKFEKAFFEDLAALSIQLPEHIPYATANISEMVTLIQQLAAKDIAYQAEDGSWYFRLARDPDYGKLSKKDLENITDGARVDLDEYDKDSARDFALWKAVKPGETSWDTPLGPGRPGWHIECSAMATKFLGPSFDLHAGGEDLMFPHHENEIAQSECASGVTFARHWMHVRFLLVEGRKMSKSEGNFYTLRDLLLKGYRASAIRFLLISVPYRNQMNFTIEGLTHRIHQRRRPPAHLLPAHVEWSSQERKCHPERSRRTCFWERHETSRYPLSRRPRRNHRRCHRQGLEGLHRRPGPRPQHRRGPRRHLRSRPRRQLRRRPRHPALRKREQILEVLALFDGVFAILEDRDADLTRMALAWRKKKAASTRPPPSSWPPSPSPTPTSTPS